MRIALDIKNLSKLKQPSTNDVIIYDGKSWYVTTKDDILQEANDLLDECKTELESLEKANEDFKSEMAKQYEAFTQSVKSDLATVTDTAQKLLALEEGETI